MNRILCWDLEIEKPVSDNPMGWEAARRGDLGISALVISDSETNRFHIYDKHDLDEAVDHLNSADILCGFNTHDFDANVVYGVTGRYLTVQHYDILAEIYKALKEKRKGYKLEQVAQATLGHGKSGNGEFATALVAKKRWGRLFDYCLNDVHLCRELYNHIVDWGWIKGADGIDVFLEKPGVLEYA